MTGLFRKAALVFMAFCWCSTATPADLYDAGISVVDITPDYPIRLNGFGNRREESDGISQQIFARALAISQGEDSPLVLVTLDSLGIRLSLVDEVARRLQESHGLRRENLAVTFSHSHCTPKVNGACDNIFSQAIPPDHQKHIDRYTQELTDYVTTAARQALDARQPAVLEWAVGQVGFAKNRRTVGGPVDHDLPMLVVRNPADNQPRAIYVSYACHCVTLSFNQVSGDWAGYAAAMIERRVPGAVALVSIGAGSDQNPVSGVTGDQVQVAEQQGVEIATEVERLLAGRLRPITGTAKAVLNKIALPLNTLPTREKLQAQTQQGRPTDRYNAVTQLARLDRGEPLLTQIDYPIQTWSFGDSFCMMFLAGEVCVDYSLRLKQELDRERCWLNAYSNDFCCYIPSERLAEEGGYGGGAEVPYFALPATLQAGLEQRIVDEVRRQVPAAFHVPEGTQGVPPKSPSESLNCLQTHDNLQVLLAAAEPAVTDPVAIDFGPDGLLWVAEMNNYGRDVYETFEQSGRVRWLRDTDGNGEFDEARTFVDGLRFPTDVKVWRNGILICDAPDILFAQDRDGDGKADSVEKLFSGFEVRNAQARVNSLRFGLDNSLYGASGLFGGVILSHRTGQTVDCSNRDFRMDPDTGTIEPVTGRTQQGRCRNDWGDWFGCSNGSLLRAIPADDRYAVRNPLAPPSSPPGLKADEEAFRLYPPENLVTFELSGTPGRATSACGLGIYRDTLLGAEYRNDAFTCEPVHQSVHRIDLEAAGHGFIGRRGAGEVSSEFLSSTDRWFRPVQARTGPDGALWIVDMYRYVIEHPRWIPQSTLTELNVNAGQGRGRIYRVVPKPSDSAAAAETPETDLVPNLTKLSRRELITQLDSPNGTRRDLAHQLLLWRSEDGTEEDVRQFLANAQTPAGMIHALCLLDGLKKLQVSDLSAALATSNPTVVRHAVRLSEPFLSSSAELRDAVANAAKSPDVRVRRQAALSVGAAADGQTAAVIVQLLSADEADTYVRSAALNSVAANNIDPVATGFLDRPDGKQDTTTYRSVVLLALRIGNAGTMTRILTSGLPSTTRLPTGTDADFWVAALNVLDQRFGQTPVSCPPEVLARVAELHLLARDTLAAEDQSAGDYLAALKLLGRSMGTFTQMSLKQHGNSEVFSVSSRLQAMSEILSPRYSADLQRAAVDAIAATQTDEAAVVLVDEYSSLSRDTQQAVVDVLLGRTNGQLALLAAIETGQIRADVLDASHRNTLLNTATESVRTAAGRILGTARMSNRAGLVEEKKGLLQLTGDLDRGRTVFRKRCSSCHKLEGEGHVVGPDLRALTNRDPHWLLTAMLDPNKDVDARYVAWTAATQDGRTASGMIVEEANTSIRLRESGGKEHVILRSEIEEFRSSQKSVMPEGLERDMSDQDFRDVIEYVAAIETPPKTLPGNQPALVTPNEAGVLTLTATAAEIRGGDITFEKPFANIGYWHGQNDTATWKVDVPQGRQFDIYLNASCAGGAAGNQFRIDGLPEPVIASVASTGGWDRYRPVKVGTAVLETGRHMITVRPNGPLKQALFDLREVRMVPAGTAPGFESADLTDTPLPRYPPAIAPFLLDESQTTERRQQVIDQRPGMGPAIISLLVADLKPGDEQTEYRRIPWIWRVAIAVGKRNDGGEIRDLLEVCVPRDEQPLRDWQAVVIGGGLINGVSQLGLPPGGRLSEILEGLPAVQQVWPRTLDLARQMADDQTIRSGTRYDALRMVALQSPDAAVPFLLRYLTPDTPPELQMGAVSGLTDVPADAVIPPLLSALDFLKGRNRVLALEGLLRTEAGAEALLNQIQQKKLTLTATETAALKQHSIAAVRESAGKILAGETEQ